MNYVRAISALILLVLPATVPATDKADKGEKVKTTDVITRDVVLVTPEHPRNDSQMIFSLADGRLMLAWCEYYSDKPQSGRTEDFAGSRIRARFSSDRGRTWTADAVTLQDNIGKMNVKHPSMVRLPSGELLFFFTVRNSHADLQIYMKRTSDECKTWTEPVKISSLAGINFKNPDHAFRMQSGRIIVPAFWGPKYGAGFRGEAFCYYSDDDGKTWDISKTRISDPSLSIEEPTMVELKDGSILALLRNLKGTLLESRSTDRGETWAELAPTPVKAPHATSFMKRIPSTGDLLLIWNNNYSAAHHHGGERNPLTAAVSRDDGKTWTNTRDLENKPGDNFSCPDVCFAGDEAFVSYSVAEGSGNFSGRTGIRLKIVPVAWFYEE